MSYAQFLNKSLPLTHIAVEQSVSCNVHFGVPGGAGDCLQVGICRVIIDAHPNAVQDRRCRKAPASLYINDAGHYEMFFPAKEIMPCTERAIFRNKWFPVPVAHCLDQAIVAKLDDAPSQWIPMGKYPITKVAGGYVISF
jgi:hypothetical protein